MASKLRVDSILPVDGAPTSGGGGIIQVVQSVKTDAENFSGSSTAALITGLSASITPTRADSKVFVQVILNPSVGGAYAGMYAVLRRGSTDICIGDAASNRNRASMSLQSPNHFTAANSNDYGPGQSSLLFLDDPATTSSVTYGLYLVEADNQGTVLYVNKSGTDTDSNYFNRVASTITLMEVSG